MITKVVIHHGEVDPGEVIQTESVYWNIENGLTYQLEMTPTDDGKNQRKEKARQAAKSLRLVAEYLERWAGKEVK